MSQNNQSAQSGQANQIQIKATDEILKGEYANAMQVMHTKEEFVMDFLSTFPPVANLVSRVIVSPGQMKLIAKALNENIANYEKQFGNVTPSDTPKTPIGFQSE
ncbi:MAG: DUF3467 domain-containing protein [Candidatus Moranbacteria bacterium]|nr:DUF3467 domain-containing protein [Candidatus Moranbacteria bacterium]